MKAIKKERMLAVNLSPHSHFSRVAAESSAINPYSFQPKVGSLVNVESRHWPGINKPGGVGKVTAIRFDGLQVISCIDVKYVLGGNELNIEMIFVKDHSDEDISRSRRKRAAPPNFAVESHCKKPPPLKKSKLPRKKSKLPLKKKKVVVEKKNETKHVDVTSPLSTKMRKLDSWYVVSSKKNTKREVNTKDSAPFADVEYTVAEECTSVSRFISDPNRKRFSDLKMLNSNIREDVDSGKKKGTQWKPKKKNDITKIASSAPSLLTLSITTTKSTRTIPNSAGMTTIPIGRDTDTQKKPEKMNFTTQTSSSTSSILASSIITAKSTRIIPNQPVEDKKNVMKYMSASSALSLLASSINTTKSRRTIPNVADMTTTSIGKQKDTWRKTEDIYCSTKIAPSTSSLLASSITTSKSARIIPNQPIEDKDNVLKVMYERATVKAATFVDCVVGKNDEEQSHCSSSDSTGSAPLELEMEEERVNQFTLLITRTLNYLGEEDIDIDDLLKYINKRMERIEGKAFTDLEMRSCLTRLENKDRIMMVWKTNRMYKL